MYLSDYINNMKIVLLLVGAILPFFVTITQTQAETGQGDDIFRVIMTTFGVITVIGLGSSINLFIT
jgi:hypothetical protein